MCSADPKGYATIGLGNCGYISVMANMMFTYFLIKGIMFCEK